MTSLLLISQLAFTHGLADVRSLDFASADGDNVRMELPFGVGEALQYDLSARFLLLGGSGDATLRVEAIDTLRGAPAYRLVFQYGAGLAFFKVNNTDRSWLDPSGQFSHRFEQRHDQTGHQRDRIYDFLREEMRFVDPRRPEDNGPLASPQPLDDISFIYYLRTLPLRVGEVYTNSRYYKAEGNPVTIQVLRNERITVPAGTFDAVVVRPIIRTDGMFREGGDAEIWLSNDERRLVLKLRANAKVGTLTMELRSYSLPNFQ